MPDDVDEWVRAYAVLALRIDRLMRTTTETQFVDAYYGPAEWRAAVAEEPPATPADLLRQATELKESLQAQAYAGERAAALAGRALAVETVCRKLAGEAVSLAEELRGCYDLDLAWVPETSFEEALDLYRAALPGKGILATRLHEWRREQRRQLASIANERLLDMMRLIQNEVRRRTNEVVALPAGEAIDCQLVSDVWYGAENLYQGEYRSQIKINLAGIGSLPNLVDTLCHEAYPGHHAEAVLKEQRIYREQGYMEESVFQLICPRAITAEGIAMFARETIFAPGELASWLANDLMPALNLPPATATMVDGEALAATWRAAELLEAVNCNAVIMLREGRPAGDIYDYLARYLHTADLESLSEPFRDAYFFSYYYGKELVRDWLGGPPHERRAAFRHLLLHEIAPSALASNSA